MLLILSCLDFAKHYLSSKDFIFSGGKFQSLIFLDNFGFSVIFLDLIENTIVN